MTDPLDPFAAPEPGSPPVPPPPAYGTPAQPDQPPYGAPASGAPQYGAPAYGEPAPYGTPGQAHRNGMGTDALILGIVGIIPCFWFAFVPSVLAVIFGFIGRGRVKRREATNGGMAMTGIILGVLSILIGVAFWSFIGANRDAISRYDDCTTAASGNSQAEDDCVRQFVHDVFGVDLPDNSSQ